MPVPAEPGAPTRTHQQIDARSLALHRLVAQRLLEDPALLVRVRTTLSRWRNLVSVRSLPYLDEWQRVVDLGVQACVATMTEDSEHANALRQCSPFTGILPEKQRQEFLRSWRWGHGRGGLATQDRAVER